MRCNAENEDICKSEEVNKMYSAGVTEVERRKYNKNSLLKSFEVIGWKRAYQRWLKESIRKYI